jgi:hypothetical protein
MTAAHPGYRHVDKATFFASIGTLNVHPRSERHITYWETPSRQVVGISTPGYMCEGPITYHLQNATGDST